MTRASKDAVAVLATLAVSFLSLKGILDVAAHFGFSPDQFKDPVAVFEPTTILVVLAVLLAPIGIVLTVQKFWHRKRLRELGFRGPWIRPFALGAAGGVLVKLAALSVAVGFSRSARIMPVNAPRAFIVWLPYFAWYLLTLLLNSCNEELVYRAYPIAALKGSARMPVGAIIVGAAAIFSLMHFLIEPPDLQRFLYRFAFGLATGLIFARQGTLAGIVGLHTGWNFVALSFSGANWRLGSFFSVIGVSSRADALANIAALAALSVAIVSLDKKILRRVEYDKIA